MQPLQMTVRDALNSAMDEEMTRDDKVGCLIGPRLMAVAPINALF